MPGSPFSRYRNLAVIEVDGQRAIEQRPDRLPLSVDGSATHVVTGGETLDMLAARYYGRESLWWRIADANPVSAIFNLSPGDQIIIPPIRVATSTSSKAGA
jgi:nucleoid-associated protein YgaU